MAQEFCTLEQAAQMLGISPQELNNMAQRRAVRAFADRGTWRFRISDIQELARSRGVGSDAEIPAGAEAVEAEILPPEPHDVQEITAQLAEESDGDIFAEPPRKGSSRSTDSGIILVPKGSDVELLPTPDELGPASSSFVFPTAKSGSKMQSPMAPRAQSQLPTDEDDDSIVPIGKEPMAPGAGDSQVRLDTVSGRLPDSGVRLVDFDLPSQLSGIMPPPSSRKMEKPGSTINLERPAPKSGKMSMPKSGRAQAPAYEPTAQFDIEAQLASEQMSAPPSSRSSGKMKAPKGGSSSEFDLSPTQNVPGDSVFELSNPSMPSLELELTSDMDAGDADALGLEQGQLKAEEGGTGRRKRPPVSSEILAEESSGTFELKMDSDEFESMEPKVKARPESSEFDLSLEGDQTDSSDFELSLEDDGLAAPASSGPKTTKVPRSQLAAAEETSDFELALDDDSSSEIVDETDSEVVVIDDEDATAPSAIEGLGDEEVVEEAEAEPETEVVPKGAAAAAAAPAEWGWWSMALLPTVLLMPFIGMLLFEMMRGIWSYQQPGIVTGPIYELVKSVTK